MEDCVFCKVIKGELPSSKVYEDADSYVFNSNRPAAETHILIIPKKHVSTFMDLDGQMENLVKIAQKIIMDKNLVGGYKLIVNGGKYQEVPHFHLHLLAGKLESEP